MKSQRANNYYAARCDCSSGKRILIQMHRKILGIIGKIEFHADHINNNGLDNRKNNLRSCTSGQNQMNKRKWSGCSSKYKGVCWHKRIKKWGVSIQKNREPTHVGYFNTESEAALAYNEKAKELFGEFANLNNIKTER